MGITAVKIKLMPESVESDLEAIQVRTREIIESEGGKNLQLTEEPIAFGLKAIIAFFAWDEDKELENLENQLKEIPHVVSEEVTDMRRAFG